MKLSIKWIFILSIVFFLFSCNDKTEVDEILTVFKNHSFTNVKSDEIKKIISEKGVEGLKTIDPDCGFVKTSKPVKYSFKKGLTFPGFLIQKVGEKFLVRKIFESSYASDVENFSQHSEIISVNDFKLQQNPKALEYLIDNTGKVLKIEFKNGNYSATVPIKTSYPYYPVVWGFELPEINSIYLRISALPQGVSKIILNEIEKKSIKKNYSNLIIDLRSSFSGDLNGLRETMSLFSRKGELLFETISDKKGYEKKFFSNEDGILSGKKIVVIVDKETSGIMSVFASLLGNLKDAIFVGEEYSGDLNLLRTFKFKNGKFFRVTVALFGINGKALSKKIPDFKQQCDYQGPNFSLVPYPVLDYDNCYMKAYSILVNK